MKLQCLLAAIARDAGEWKKRARHKGRWAGARLRLERLEERAVPTTWTGLGGDPFWFNRLNWDTLTVPGSGDNVTIPDNSPQVLLAEPQGQGTTIAGLTMSGAIEMRTDLIVIGPMSWTKGTIFADGAQNTHLRVQGVFLSGPDPKSLHGNISVENSGLMNWSGGDVIATTDPWGRPTFANSGTVNLNDDVSFRWNFFPEPQFICEGTLRKQGGTGTSTIGGLTASGPVVVDSGTLALDGNGTVSGPVTLAAGTSLSFPGNPGHSYTLVGTTVSGPGTLKINSNGTLDYSGNVTVQNLNLVTNGVLTIPTGQMANLTISGSMDWSGGTISGGLVTINGTLTVHGDDDKFLIGCVLDNAGLATWTDAGAIVGPMVGQAVIWNNLAGATFDVQNQAPFIAPAGNVSFFNAGTFRKSVATVTGLAVTFSNSGLLDLAPGAILDVSVTYHGQRYTSPHYTWQAGASDTGTGTVLISASTLTVAGNSSVPNLTLAVGGTINGTATLTVDGLFNWTGGTLSGAGTILAPGGINISGSDRKVLLGWTIDNAALAVWTGAGGIDGTNATWNNLAASTFQDSATGQLSGNGGGGGASTHFNNAGTYEATITAPLYHLVGVLFDNSGAVQVDPGLVLSIFDSTLTMEDGSSEGGGGSFLVSGRTLFDVMGAASVENVTLQTDGDIVSGVGTLSITGLLHWDAGTMANGHVQFQGPIVIGPNPVALNNFILDNAGTVTWTGTSTIVLDSASVWNNQPGSLLDAQNNGIFRIDTFGHPQPHFNNAGTFRKSAGTGTTPFQEITFTNTGSVEVLSGTVDLLGNFPNFSGTTLTGGSYFVHGTLRFQNADIRTNAATIILDGPAASIRDTSFPSNDALANFTSNTGAGAFSLQGNQTFATPNDFTNAGTVNIAAGSTLNVRGMYAQSAGLTVLAGGTLTAANLVDIEGGALDGFGTINGNVRNAATVNVGGLLAAGTLTINGDYTQTAAADLLVQIGGPNAGIDYSQLSVSGRATLDGTLTVTLINGFVPNAGDSFEVLTYGSAGGAFATLDGDGPLFNTVYDAGGLALVKS
jgi:hypothetical protein